MKRLNGLWWPDSDQVGYKIISEEVGFLDQAIKHCRDTRLAIQAGGNCGIYPLYLGDRFDTVITIEADRDNYACLKLNVEHEENVFPLFGALGDKQQRVGINRHPENNGASHITQGDEVTMFLIDGMGVDCDLIQLDIEGFEYQALKGAEQTIKGSHPVVMIEEAGHGGRYGKEKPHELLESWGYELVESNRTDLIWRFPHIRN